ncbi:MAG: glycoside hydrolase family 95 protein [Candidatus Lokiarchaeota archaeon]|nr:glycoside hydrolase family 95 protein [Candidatus Lokiarchaeota archaeon]
MQAPATMHNAQPATRWEDATPVGNGSIGALIYGNICHETIVLNHESLWIYHDKPEPPDISGTVPELREMLANGEWSFADMFLDFMLREKGYDANQVHKDNYHPSFNVRVDMEPSAPFTGYRRELDMATGEARVSWTEGRARHTRRCFVSRASDLFCMRISCDSGDVGCKLVAEKCPLVEQNAHSKDKRYTWDDVPITFEVMVGPGWFHVTGTYKSGGQFGGVGHVVAPGGRVSAVAGRMEVAGAREVVVVVKLFANEAAASAIPRVEGELAGMHLDGSSYDVLLREHAALHQALYDRLEIDLGADPADRQKSNEQLLLDAYDGDVPTALVERMFLYGRYLLVSSSRPGGWPANLQGVWNGYYFPPWASDYHNDENVQMNYWAALPGNLAETTLPYFDFYEACLPECRRNARVLYGCRGIFAPIAQTMKGVASLYGGPWLNWVSGAGWLGQLFYDFWRFTRDDAFLRDRAIPYLREVAAFYEDFLVEGPGGKVVFSPSLSPENVPSVKGASLATVNATMDVAVAREVLSTLVAGCERLGIEADGVARWNALIAKLPAYEVNADGAIKEWIDPRLPDNYHHRHLSHVYPLFPGLEITREGDPRLYAACRVAVEKRLVIGQESQSGWSLAHMSNIWARLHDGDHALGCIETLARSCVGPNLFTYHNDWRHMGITLYWNFIDKIFQIDANFGLVAGVLEMLVFSRENEISILPALPKKWKRGYISGVATRAGVVVSVEWDVGIKHLRIELSPKLDTNMTIQVPGPVASFSAFPESTQVSSSSLGKEFKIVSLRAGKAVEIEIVTVFGTRS